MVGWIIFLGQPTAFSTKLRGWFVALGTPFIKLGDAIPFVHARRQLARDNQQLRDENNHLRQQVRFLSEAGRENLELSRLLKLKQQLPIRALGARVISRDTSNWWRSLQIDRGTTDGLRENLAVVSADGVVGKIISATSGEARVLLLIDPNCKAAAVLQDTREPGIVAGHDTAFVRELQYTMTFVNRDAKVKPGEAVITSGLGGVFPKGLLIGTVLNAQLNQQTGMYQDLAIKPAADFRRLENVMVLLP